MDFPLQLLGWLCYPSNAQHIESLTVPWEKNSKEKPSGEKFLSSDTKFHIQHWFHFHHIPFPKQTVCFPVNWEVWGCRALELCESHCWPRSNTVCSLLSFLVASWGFIFCQRSILSEWQSNTCAGGRMKPGVSHGTRDGWFELVIGFWRWYLVCLVFWSQNDFFQSWGDCTHNALAICCDWK